MQDLAGIFFDLDGTLIDSAACIVECWSRASVELALPTPSPARIRAAMGIPAEVCVPAIFGELGRTLDAAGVDAFLHVYRSHNADLGPEMVTLYPGIHDVLDVCDRVGVPAAVVTSKKSGPARRNLADLGVEGRFAVLIGSDSVTRHKPQPDPVFAAADALGIARSRLSNVLVVGDAGVDIDMGRAAGCVTFAALWGAHDRSAVAHAHASGEDADDLRVWLDADL